MFVILGQTMGMRSKYFLTFCCVFLITCMYAADTTHYAVFMGSRSAGTHMAWQESSGARSYYYEFNDRGRGPAINQTVMLSGGQLSSMQISGHDYTKNQIDESFTVRGGTASWLSSAEEGQQSFDGELYYPVNGTPAGMEQLIEVLDTESDQTKNLLPGGALRISLKYHIDIDIHKLTLYGISGVSYAPDFYWIDEQGLLFAIVSPSRGITCIKKGFEDLKTSLVEKQVEVEDEYFSSLADELTEIPEAPVAITDVRLYNAHKGKMEENKTVVFADDKITGVFNALPANFEGEVIDGKGKSLVPGLFDMHVHVGQSAGILHVAAGVTSVRDMAVQSNYIEDKNKLKADFESNNLIGPRIVGLAGFIDGNGPFTRDRGIDNVEEGLAEIEKFNEAGLKQIKLYSSIKPEWVEPMAELAHSYGMRVSGHIPAFMTATTAIEQGFDEIQHTNMLFLNFYGDTLDTRNMTRFSAVGENGHTFDFNSKQFKDFVKLLKRENVVIDPTLAIFEWGFTSVMGEASPPFVTIIDRLPLSDRRRFYNGGFARPPGVHQTYLESYDRMVDMVFHLHKNGIAIVPGTDNLAGFTFHRELELYVKSGIPASEVLQLATIGAAKVADLDASLGTIEAGKLADMVLVNGNPVDNISDIRNVVLTVKNGMIYRPKKLYTAVGINWE